MSTGALPEVTGPAARRAVRYAWFTIGYNLVEGVVAVAAGLVASAISLGRVRHRLRHRGRYLAPHDSFGSSGPHRSFPETPATSEMIKAVTWPNESWIKID